MQYSLNGIRKLSYTDPDKNETVHLNISVPGNVETAMQEYGLSGDFMPADDLYSHEKYDWVDDWTFERSFDAVKAWSERLLEIYNDITNMNEYHTFVGKTEYLSPFPAK